MMVSIDPGEDLGWAIWSTHPSAVLLACGLGDPRSSPKHIAEQINQVWIESQVIYPRSKAPPADIIKLAQTAGYWAGVYSTLAVDAHFVEPHAWKGSTPKDIHHARIWATLSAVEQKTMQAGCAGVAPKKRHNVLDAVGIGLFAAQRRVK